MRGWRYALWLLPACLALAHPARAATVVSHVGSGSSPQLGSASATFTLGDGFITMALSNANAHPYDADQLLTSLDTTHSGVSQGSLRNALDSQATADDGGIPSQNPVNPVTASNLASPTRELTGSGGDFRLEFHPDARCANQGPAEAAGEYTFADASVECKPGHNPYSSDTATLTLNAPGVTPNTTISDVRALFGKDLDTSVLLTTLHVPVPASLCTGLSLLVALGALDLLRRRNATID